VKDGTDRVRVEAALGTLVPDAVDRELVFERWDTEASIENPAGPPA
jgi:hypothetical protein